MKRLCIYATVGKEAEQVLGRYVSYALRKCKEVSERLVVVTDIRAGHPHFDEINNLADLIVHSPQGVIDAAPHGYRLGLAALDAQELETYDEIIFTGSACYGPIYPLAPILDDPKRREFDFWSVGFSQQTKPSVTGEPRFIPVLNLDFLTVNRRVVSSDAFRRFIRRDSSYLDRLRGVRPAERIHLAFEAAGFKWSSFIDPGRTHTANPLLFEAAEMLRLGCPIILRSIFTTDPLEIDIGAVQCREVMQTLVGTKSDFGTDLIWESLLPCYPLRVIQSNMDDLRILPSGIPETQKRRWDFGGKIAVIAHIFYVEMLPEFLEIAANIPCEFDFFITTSSEENKAKIEAGLETFDCGGKKEVRVVEQNRGRDMSSLFISFKDVVLSGQYAWILRLHSKRTPQVSWQIGQSFKRHLIENLVPSRQFVQSLFDLLERPDYWNVGVVVPPVVHIGFGTLGHSWYSNRRLVEKLAKELKIGVPLDEATPVAAYGTMYWFRPRALAPMFQYGWKWEDYNAEPNHSDGGLAHAQERLICYCAQEQGFRTLAVMSAGQAERNYLKLEYKHQALAGCFPVRDIRHQYKLAKSINWRRAFGWYSRFLQLLENFDEWLRHKAPWLWKSSRSAIYVLWPILKRLER